jgi:Cys-tRNA(Pro)/Cys-tRNA(Cys) deacylase
MSTRAIQFLVQKGVSFDVVKYGHESKGAEFAADAIGFPLEKTIKTLVADLGYQNYTLALMPGDKQLSLRRLAKANSAKKAVMANTATAERLTGYLVGGISPFATKQRLTAVMEESLLNFDRVAINGGQRGLLLKMATVDIVKILNCKITKIARE